MPRKKLAQNYPRTVVAMVTPIVNDRIDDGAVNHLIRFPFAAGTGAVLICGTTGESATMTHAEHQHVIDLAVAAAAECRKQFPKSPTRIWAGTGSNSTKEAVELTRHATGAGVDVLLVITPYYNRPTPAGLEYHYRAISDATDLPIVAYNVPSRTGTNMTEDVVARLAVIPNLAGVKEASGNITQIMNIGKSTPDDFLIWSGDDALTLPILSVGGVGVISVTANLVPWEIEAVIQACLCGKTDKALRLHRRLLDLHHAMFIETNPIPVKTSLNLIHDAWQTGVPEGPVGDKAELLRMLPSVGELRPPLVPMTEGSLARLKRVLASLGLIGASA